MQKLGYSFFVIFWMLFMVHAAHAQNNEASISPYQQAVKALQVIHDGNPVYSVDDLSPRPQTLTLKCAAGLPAGTNLRLIMNGFRMVAHSSWKMNSVQVVGEGEVRTEFGFPGDFSKQMERMLRPQRHQDIVMARFEISENIGTGSAIRIELEGKPGKSVNAPFFGFMFLDVAHGSSTAFRPIGQLIVFKKLPGQPKQVEVRTKSGPDEFGNLSVSIFLKDQFDNPVRMTEGRVQITPRGSFSNLPQAISWSRSRDGLLTLHNVRLNRDNPGRIEVFDEVTGSSMLSQAILPGKLDGYGHYFGEIHAHTEESYDGGRPLSQAYDYAKNYLLLDVLSTSEHIHNTDVLWKKLLRAAEHHNDPGHFVTLPGWEVGGNNGHVNVYMKSLNTGIAMSDANHAWQDVSTFDAPEDIITIPHVTRSYGHPRFDWSRAGKRMRLVEMIQGRGVSEDDVPDEKWGINPDPKKKGGAVREALAMGKRIGFVAGTDDHMGFPTRHHYHKGYFGMSGFVSKDLTREAIFNAMDKRHTYATSGVPIICHFKVYGSLIGSEISIGENDQVVFEATLHGTDEISLVEIISGDQIIKKYTPGKLDVKISEQLPTPENSAYFYLRLLQKDGHRAWASPVWVNVE